MSSEGIFVVTEEGLLPVQGIMQDAQGIYYVSLPLGYWKCRNGHPNPPWRLTCAVPGCNG